MVIWKWVIFNTSKFVRRRQKSLHCYLYHCYIESNEDVTVNKNNFLRFDTVKHFHYTKKNRKWKTLTPKNAHRIVKPNVSHKIYFTKSFFIFFVIVSFLVFSTPASLSFHLFNLFIGVYLVVKKCYKNKILN